MRNSGYKADPTSIIYDVAAGLDEDVLRGIWKERVDGKTMVWTVVGDSRKIDMDGLASFGEIVELKVKDIMK